MKNKMLRKSLGTKAKEFLQYLVEKMKKLTKKCCKKKNSDELDEDDRKKVI